MNRLFQAAFYGALFTIYGGSIYYVFAVAETLIRGGDMTETFFKALAACCVAWVFFTFVLYEVLQAFDEMNKAGRRKPDNDLTGDGPEDPNNGEQS